MDGCGPMYCLKCGKETAGEQVFCDHCLEIMEQYPVKPDTHIQLPHRDAALGYKKASRRRIRSHEEQLRQLRVTVRVLLVCLLVTLTILGLFLWQHFRPETVTLPEKELGQNYTVTQTTEPTN